MIQEIIDSFFFNREAGIIHLFFLFLQNTKLLYRFMIEPNLNVRFDDFFED